MFAASSSTPTSGMGSRPPRAGARVGLGGVAQRHRQRGDQARLRAAALLGEQVQRVGCLAHEPVEVELRPAVLGAGWAAPGRDLRVAQELRGCARRCRRCRRAARRARRPRPSRSLPSAAGRGASRIRAGVSSCGGSTTRSSRSAAGHRARRRAGTPRPGPRPWGRRTGRAWRRGGGRRPRTRRSSSAALRSRGDVGERVPPPRSRARRRAARGQASTPFPLRSRSSRVAAYRVGLVAGREARARRAERIVGIARAAVFIRRGPAMSVCTSSQEA